MTQQWTIPYVPQEKQRLLHHTKARQVFFGGSAGGGKTVSMRWDAIAMCLENPGLQAYIFRRKYPELEETHIRGVKREIPLFVGQYNETRKRLEFKNGSTITFCHCEREDDVINYLSVEMHWLGVDEASQFTPHQLKMLRTRVRLGNYKPKKPEFLPRIVFSSNPGGPSHSFLKNTFIDSAPPATIFPDPDTGWPSIFIPAKMKDNKYIDADYAASFSALPEALAKAYRDGDWDAVVGQALERLSRDRHMLRSFTPPRHWTRFSALDWGTAKPFVNLWFCVSEGALLEAKDGWTERWLPSGAMIIYREWYGWNGKHDEGCRMESHEVARGILKMENDWGEQPIDYRLADSQMWAQTDGPTPAERFRSVDPRLNMRPWKKDRRMGYQEVRARIAGDAEGHPMLFVTENCTHWWRTVPPMVLDHLEPEKGPDTKQEDHCYDALAGACRSRPMVFTEKDRFEIEYAEAKKQRKTGTDPYATY